MNHPFQDSKSLIMSLLTMAVLGWFVLSWCLGCSFQAVYEPESYAFNLLLGLLLSAPALVWGRLRLQAVIVTVLALWMEANLMYSRIFFLPIPASAYLLASNGTQYAGAALTLLRWWPDTGFLVIVGAAWMVALRHKRCGASFSKRALAWWGAATGIAAAACCTLIMAGGGIREVWFDHSEYTYYPARPVMFTIPGWIWIDSYINDSEPSQSELEEVSQWLSIHKAMQGNPPTWVNAEKPKSLLLITVESLESWPIGLRIEGKEVTPTLNALLSDTTRNVFFAPKMVSQTAIGRSIDAQLLVNIGMLPPATSVWAIDHMSHHYPNLPSALEHNGATGIQLTMAKPSNWNQGAVCRLFGVDSALFLDDWRQEELFFLPQPRPGDRSLIRQAVERMKAGLWPEGQNAFCQIITLSSHTPWEVPPEYEVLHLKGNYESPVGEYLSAVAYTDNALKPLLDYIYSRSDADNIMTVIIGDHEGIDFSRPRAAAQYPFVGSEPLVPFIVVNGPVSGRFDEYAGQIDAYSTLIDMLGLQAPEGWNGMGFSLVRPGHPYAAVNFKGRLFGSPDSATEAHLRQAWRVSDFMIRHDFLTGNA